MTCVVKGKREKGGEAEEEEEVTPISQQKQQTQFAVSLPRHPLPLMKASRAEPDEDSNWGAAVSLGSLSKDQPRSEGFSPPRRAPILSSAEKSPGNEVGARTTTTSTPQNNDLID